MIGTQAEADVAARFVDVDRWAISEGTVSLPDGWSFAGAGCSRTALRSPSGVIYKIPRGKHFDYAQNQEYLVALHFFLFGLPSGWDVPKIARFRSKGNIVIAMEDMGDVEVSISGDDYNLAAGQFGVCDPHSGNIRRRQDGTIVLIDLGFAEQPGLTF